MLQIAGPGIPFEKPAIGFPGWPTPTAEEIASEEESQEVISASVSSEEEDDSGSEPVSEPIEEKIGLSLAEALTCLEEKSTVYGVALANANVRAEPDVEGCYMGRVPKERIVRITQAYVQGSDSPFNNDANISTDVSTQENRSIGYIEDIQPIFQRSCSVCHGEEPQSGELKATEYEALMAGGKSGRVIIPGDSSKSLLWFQVSNGIMPMTGPLPEDEQQLIQAWIDGGALRERAINEEPSRVQPSESLSLWWALIEDDVDIAPNRCDELADTVVSSELIAPVGCNEVPSRAILDQVLANGRPNSPTSVPTTVATIDTVDTPTGEVVTAVSIVAAVATPNLLPTTAPFPTAAPFPTPLPVMPYDILLPTSTALPVALTVPQPIAEQPFNTPIPTFTPRPTNTPVTVATAQTAPVSTPSPLPAALPTSTEAPTPTTLPTLTTLPTPTPTTAATPTLSPSEANINVSPLGLDPPSDADPWLIPQGGYCIEQRLFDNERSITALAFAPDGRLFMGLDASPADEPDPYVLYDAHHPSRSIAVYNPVSDSGFGEILTESTRVTGLDYHNGAIYVSRAGEVGYIPDGGQYQPLAGGFAVASRLFHANNGLVVLNGWLYISAGGVMDGFSDGPIQGMTEQQAQNTVAGGNPYASRLVRASVDRLLTERSIGVFQTAARGLRNPYGLAADIYGRLWITDNGATNVPNSISAGDEVNLFDPRSLSPEAAAGDEEASPFYGFPLALNGSPPAWYSGPILDLANASAPTGVTWAYDTVFFAVYGTKPGLYRMARGSNGQIIAERVMLVWPLISMTTAPDGSLWIGTGEGGLYRLTPGC